MSLVPTPLFPTQTGVDHTRKAPRRQVMTKVFTGALANNLGPTALGATSLTYLAIFPIEAPCYAARVLFANHRADTTYSISKVSIYPSSTYSNGIAMNADRLGFGSGGRWVVQPTGGSVGYPMYFDGAGADVNTINTAATTRNLTLAADAGNVTNGAWPYTYKYTDWSPCFTIPRTDGGPGYLLFVYVTVSSGQIIRPLFAPGQFTDSVNIHRNRQVVAGHAWTSNSDFADNPTGTDFKGLDGLVPCGIQYLSASPGVTIMVTGDSLSTSPSGDGYSTGLNRAAWDLSTPSLPIEVCNVAFGGANMAVYGPTFDNNIQAVRPGIIALQPQSRNDGFTLVNKQTLIAHHLLRASRADSIYKSLLLWNQPAPEPTAVGQSNIDAFYTLRNRFLDLERDSGVWFMDGPRYLGAGAEPYKYMSQQPVSTDGIHPNTYGIELLVPRYREILTQMIY